MNATKKFRDEREVLSDLNHLVSAENYIEVLASLVIRDFSGSAEKIRASDVYDILSYNELAFLIGLWIKNHTGVTSPNDPEILIEQTDRLLKEYHNSMFYNNIPAHDEGQNLYEYFHNNASYKEAIYYSSTAGYDDQYIRLLAQKYAYDEAWLKEKKQIALTDLPLFFNLIKKLVNGKLQMLHSSRAAYTSKHKLAVFIFTKEELSAGRPSFEAIIDLLTLPLSGAFNTDYKDIADFNSFTERPIIFLPDGKYFIPVPYYVAEALYESPFYWMYGDKGYKAIAAKNRGQAAEDLVYAYVSKLFGTRNTWRNVNIKIDIATTLTDIDVIAYTGDTAIIFQIKSKKLTQKSRQGNLESIQSDFKKAVKDAQHQADLSIIALKNPASYKFETGDQGSLHAREVPKYEKVIVLLDQYPAICHLTHILYGEELDHTPIAFSIFDLETLFEYLKTPDRFVDYIHRRTLYSKQYRSANEMQYLGYYLEYGMEKPETDEYIYIDPDYGQSIDSKQHQKLIDQVKKENAKTGRNDACPCGSGKKFKKCHG